jgi:4-hydroxybenzoate polyprenyltransferase
MSILSGVILAAVLLTGGLLLASMLNWLFLLVVIFYFITSFTYSVYFKRIVLYDVFILALLYSIRVFAGGIVTDISLSFWLIAFSTFIFLSLAFVKRYSELAQVKGENGLKDRGREYFTEDIHLLQTMGIVSGFMSVIVFSLYIDSKEVRDLYHQPKLLWAISLLFLFWISRIWLITIRGKMTDDPIVFALKDKTSYFIFIFVAIIIFVSI